MINNLKKIPYFRKNATERENVFNFDTKSFEYDVSSLVKILSTYPPAFTDALRHYNIMHAENANSNTRVNTVLTTKPIFSMTYSTEYIEVYSRNNTLVNADANDLIFQGGG